MALGRTSTAAYYWTISDNGTFQWKCLIKMIRTVKMETRHSLGGPFGRAFLAYVIIVELWRPEVARSGNFVSNFCVFWKTIPLKLSPLRISRPKSATTSPSHLDHIIPDFIQIGSLSAELLMNAWRQFLPWGDFERVFTIYRLFEPITRPSTRTHVL